MKKVTTAQASSPNEPRSPEAGGTQPAKAQVRGQGRPRGLAVRLLSALGGLLTLITFIAAAVLLVAPPLMLDEASPASEPPTATPGDGATTPPAPGPGADASAASGLPPGLAAGLAQLAMRVATTDPARIGRVLATLAPQGLQLRDTTFVLRDTPVGDALPVRLENLRLQAATGGWRLDAVGRIDSAAPVPFEAEAAVRGPAGSERLIAQIRLVEAAGLADLAAVDQAVGGLALAGAGVLVDLETALTDGAPTGPVDVAVRSLGPLTVQAATMPGPLAVDTLMARLAWDRPAEVLALQEASIVSPAFELKAHGQLDPAGLALTVAMDRVDAARARDVWPRGVAEGARLWVTQNIPNGRIDDLELVLDLDERALAGTAIEPAAIAGTANVSGAEIHYLRPMPPVTDARARATFDANALHFAIASGRLADVTVDGGEVVISDYGTVDRTERVEVDVTATGPVSTILAVTDSEPLRLATRHDLPVATSAGEGRFRVQVGLPLLQDVALDDVDLGFDGTFTGVDLPGMAAGRDLTAATVRLDATADTVAADGEGRIGGLPLAFSYRLDTAASVQRLTANGVVDGADLRAFGLPAAVEARGPVGVEATVDITGTTERTQLGLDLTATEIGVPLLALWKPAGLAGELTGTIVEEPNRTAIAPLRLAWSGVRIEATGAVDAGGEIEKLRLDPLVIAGTELRVNAAREAGLLAVDITGARLDLQPLVRALDAGASEADDDAPAWPDLALSWSIDEVASGGAAPLIDARGTARTTADGIEAARLTARSAISDAALRLELHPDGDNSQRLTLDSDDAGTALGALGLASTVKGGTFKIAARVAEQRPDPQVSGTLDASAFVLAGTPGIVRLLAAMPPNAGIAAGDLRVDQLTTPFRVDGEVLSLDDAYLRASNLAMRASGTLDLAAGTVDMAGSLAPLAALNRFLGSVPVLGPILQGSKEAGAFALSFTVQGPRADPSVSVNPLSVVTPGVLQDLFAGTEMQPPRVRDN